MKKFLTKKSAHKTDFKGALIVNLTAMKSLLKLVNASFWQSISGPVMTFAFPMFFVGMYGYIMKEQFAGDLGLLKSSIVGIIAMMGMSFAVNAVPQWINEFKQSVLLKRIGITPIRPVTFILTVSIFTLIILILQFVWILMWIAIWFAGNLFALFDAPIWSELDKAYNNGHILWGEFLISAIYQTLVSICIGLFIVSMAKSALASNVIAMIVFFLSQFLSGMVFPIQFIANNATLNVLSHLTPFRYTSGNLTMAWDGASPFDWTKDFVIYNAQSKHAVNVYPVYDIILNNFMPILFIVLAVYTSAKKFKWNAR